MILIKVFQQRKLPWISFAIRPNPPWLLICPLDGTHSPYRAHVCKILLVCPYVGEHNLFQQQYPECLARPSRMLHVSLNSLLRVEVKKKFQVVFVTKDANGCSNPIELSHSSAPIEHWVPSRWFTKSNECWLGVKEIRAVGTPWWWW